MTGIMPKYDCGHIFRLGNGLICTNVFTLLSIAVNESITYV